MTLAEFVAARLDEAEAVAKRAAECDKMRLIGAERGLAPGDWSWLADYGQPQPGDIALIDHQVLHDPARALREVVAWRAMLEGHTGTHRCAWGDYAIDEMENCVVQLRIAAIDGDHPDYREDWRP